MLKWAKTRQRGESECSNDVETCSTISSDSSESSITVPIRYHERRASRPKSLALSSTDVLDLDQEHPVLTRGGYRTASTQMLAGSNKRGSAKRHSMIVSGTRDVSKLYSRTDNNDLNAADDIDDDILRISTADCDKPKSRNSFWKNLRAKAQGKKSDRKLEKAHSLSNIPALSRQSETEATTPTNNTTSTTPVIMRKEQRSLADCVSPSRAKASVTRRRSFKLIKKQNENKKPKAFTKSSEPGATEGYLPTGSPDSGISSIRGQSTGSNYADSDDGDSPLSPITPINLPSDTDGGMSCIRQQFTSAVLEYLNERLEKKGYHSIMDRSSSTSSAQSEDGAPDIFCYDTDTVARRPSHSLSNKQRVPISH